MTTEPTAHRRPTWLTPRRWTVRWRLAGVSAGLTLLILLVFAFVVGRLATERLKGDFHDDMFSVANQLRLNIEAGGLRPGQPVVVQGADLNKLLLARDAAIRVVYESGGPYLNPQTGEPVDPIGTPELGVPQAGEVTEVGRFDVVSVPIFASTPVVSAQPLFLQYGRNPESLNATIDRLWLFLGGGVVGGTILAMLAGIAVAGRAMRPIAALTQTAREIAATRDPSRRVPVPDRDDEIGELAVTLDQMLHELDAARTETEQIAQAQREFVADASHELRTPLTSILANLELLQARLVEGPANGGEEAEMVDGALSSSRRMRRLVADLLLLARADAGRAGVRSDCDLEQIAATALAEIRPVADEHELITELPDSLPIEGDPDELHRLISNLLENAVRHTPAGTRVHLTLRQEGDEAVVDVSDDGPGIPAGMEEQVFSRFVRGTGPADSVADGGTGLGLAIVQAVAVSHGGSVEPGLAPHGGARFVVRLPLASRTKAATPQAPAPV